MLREVYGDDSCHVALARSQLGANLVEQGRFAEAEPLLLEGHAKIAATMGDPTNFYVYDSNTRLVPLYARQGREDDARPYRDALANAVRTSWVVPPWTLGNHAFGPEHARLKAAITELDALCGVIGYSTRPGTLQAQQLEGPFAELSAAWSEELEPDEPRSLIVARYVMGWTNAVAQAERSGDVLEKMASAALAVLETVDDELLYGRAEAHVLRALAAHRRSEEQEAFAQSRRAAELMRSQPQRASWWNTIVTIRVARGFAALDWYDEAESLLVPALEIIANQLGPRHSETAATRRILSELYTAWGKPDEAAKYAPESSGR